MNRFVGDDLWTQLERVAKCSPKIVAVAYISDSTIRLGKGDTIITNASRGAIESSKTSARSLVVAQARGATVYSLPSLHAKLILTDDAAFIGSANLSRNSRHLLEAGIISTDAHLRTTVRRYLDRLKRLAGRQMTTSDLRKLQAIPVIGRSRTHYAERTDRPSLLEALESDRALLDTVAFTWYAGGHDLGQTVVQKEALSRGVPLPSGGRWTWFESPRTKGIVSATRRLCAGRPLVSWCVDYDDNGLVWKFWPHDDYAAPLIEVFAFRSHVVSVVPTDSSRSPSE